MYAGATRPMHAVHSVVGPRGVPLYTKDMGKGMGIGACSKGKVSGQRKGSEAVVSIR